MSSGGVEGMSGSESESAAAEVAQVELCDAQTLGAYLRRVVGVLLEDATGGAATGRDVGAVALDQCLRDNASVDTLRRFIAEPQAPVLLVERLPLLRDVDDGEVSGTESEVDGETAAYSLSTEVKFNNQRAASVVLVKRGAVVEAEKPIAQQVRVISLNDGNPYETLHAYVSSTVSPYFKSYIRESGRGDSYRDGDKLAPSVEKKLAELEIGLLHLQQNIEIPDISLPPHQAVQAAIKKSADEGRRAKVADFGDRVDDSSFLNQLQNGVNRWIREIQKVTKLDRDPSSGTALQEITFWLNLERALQKLQEKRDSQEVALTLDILKHGKRFHATVSFDADTGLKQALAQVNDYNMLMKDFPLNELLSASELERIRAAIAAIFGHLRKVRNTKYPIQRCLRLVEAISNDVQTQLMKVLGSRRLMHIPMAEFDTLISACLEVFSCWDDEYDKLQALLRDLVKKKRGEPVKMIWRINFSHKKLQARLEQMKKFRRQHEQLRSVIARVLRPAVGGRAADDSTAAAAAVESADAPLAVAAQLSFSSADANAIEEVNVAYEHVKEVDCLDLSTEGTDVWEAAMRRYEERIERVEARITTRLRDQLGGAKDANEMFQIFSRFNALFVRPHIRGAIREYQAQLIQRVKEDIDALQQQFTVRYGPSKASSMSAVRDLPPVSGSIIWIKQIDRQLGTYLKRVEDVLGKSWESHVEGQRLKQEGDNFRQKLNTQHIFDDWVAKVQQRHLQIAGKVFVVESQRRASGRPLLRLRVNFSPEVITLAKEVRNLKNMAFRVPLAVVNKAHQANQLYPFAISLLESVRTYDAINERVAERKDLSILIAGMKKDIQALITEGSALVWESYKLDPYVKRFAETISKFQEQVEEVLLLQDQLEVQLAALATCQFSAPAFEQIITAIQKAIDALSLGQFSNLSAWVQRLDETIESKLAFRLQEGIKAWTRALEGRAEEEDLDSTDHAAELQRIGGDPVIQTVVHEMRLTQQLMYLMPSIEEARQNIMQQLFAWEAIVTNQSRISATRFQVGLEKSPTDASYRNLLAVLPEGQHVLEQAYTAIESRVGQVQAYVDEWLRYQALWDLQPDMLYERLGTDLGRWMKTLMEIKKARGTFDTSETRRAFGAVVVDYAKVQSKVSLKYDSWHREVLQRFGTALGGEMQSFYADVGKARAELEQHSVDAAPTSDAVAFITFVQGLKRRTDEWTERVELFRSGQRVLERQRFQFPTAWLYADHIDGEWSAYADILSRKDSAIQTQVANLQAKIRDEDKAVEGRIADSLGEWEKNKPIEGAQRPEKALASLQAFEAKLARLRDDRDNIVKAKDALDLTGGSAAPPSVHSERLTIALEELADLKGVWQSLAPLYAQLDEMRDKSWPTVQPRKLRQQLDALLGQLKELPAKYRTYDSYERAKALLQGYTKVNALITELKSESLKERHWKQLMKQLRVNWILNDLSLGQVWDAELQRHEPLIRDVLLVAQGEMALEEFLKQVREAWLSYELELVNYQNKTKLIRGWDDLFNKLKEHINSLTAMKLSPYYKEFEEDAVAWEDKLNRVNALFDVWIDVQRRWVYLEGIFTGSADIKTLLPVETSRFQSISTEFLGLMRKVASSPRVMEIVNIQGVQRLLERLADLLAKIQKALGEYLERERASFPRFYFVGDEDLLEIIGNSKNIARLQKHFKKMFAGVASVVLNEDETIVRGLASREGEEIYFHDAVSIKDHPRINDWLQRVESEMRNTLAKMLAQAVHDFEKFKSGPVQPAEYMQWLDKFPAQIVLLAAQISWSEEAEALLGQGKELTPCLQKVDSWITLLADSVLQEQPALRRKKLEHLITEFVHKRDVTRGLIRRNVKSSRSFDWLRQMRFYFEPTETNVLRRLRILMANASFHYGFEYLGVQERLVQTPLTDRCYLTMTQALEARLGGSPFGPAGTGKTETVKALGNQLGRFVLVFNCDERFDFQAMGRIFVGLCQVGAWGCFDEFNRLEERMLSAVSQQVQAIQETLRSLKHSTDTLTVDLIGRQVRVNPDMAMFITMNPGYAGRSNLPDNLKQLFRSLAMTKPDGQLIAQVMLFSQGFRTAEKLAQKIVPFFTLCDEQLSHQSHYDFGLRALKYVLVSSGNVKRDRIQRIKEESVERGDVLSETAISEQLPEQEILIQSVCETMVPKLVAEDIPLLFSLLSDVFPGIPYTRAEMKRLREEIRRVCEERFLCYSDTAGELGAGWVEKVLQLYQITQLNHGLMMVGPSGSGKSTAWRVLLTALERLHGVEGVAHVIDPKAINKEALYGTLDPNTREWTDGLFTHILRKIVDNVRGELDKRQWIILDGDVDPEWVENLNSVLDDNKLLTLPNGERLAIPPNVRIMFEVQDLQYATLATVSRCGMVWFSEDVVTAEMCFENYLRQLRGVSLDEVEAATARGRGRKHETSVAPTADSVRDELLSPNIQVQRDAAQIIAPHFAADGLVLRCLQFAEERLEHVMQFTRLRALGSLFSMINFTLRQIQMYNLQHGDFPMQADQLERFVLRSLVSDIVWAFAGDGRLKVRQELSAYVRIITTIPLPPVEDAPVIDYEVSLAGEWVAWASKVPQIEIETHRVAATDLVVPTVDTVRHEKLLSTWLAEHKPVVLCGPPGSGKTMTLFSALRSMPDMEVVGLNFSSATSPELMMKTFAHYCEYRRTPNGVVLSPIQMGKWLVLFCDEINLPNNDKYGTQRVISFLRQMVEHNGFYRTSDHTWVTLERIQFVGACNPPTDPGRKPLSLRFLRHVPVVYVDYPGELSLKQIYGTFNRAMLRMIGSLRAYADPLTAAMVDFYLASQERFTQDQQPHYVYSPRELTRWVRGICEAVRPLESLSVEGLVRIWAHEAIRLFQDRLITTEERKWTDENIDATASKHFPNVNALEALQRPILYSCWLTRDYLPVDREELRDYVKARLKVFYEEELDVPLVLFNEVLDHVLRIDRIFRQPQGHLLLIGVSGSGKTTLSRFVAWMNGLSVFQLKVHSKYTAADFDEDLRAVLRRAGCRDEKICFIMDEANVLDSGFLERINTLLANGEVPGLFEGDEFATLMTQIKEGAQRDGHMLDSAEELYRWFTAQVTRNLHVVFTMNPSTEGLRDRAATSPALFNRCVLNWFGDWPDSALFQVGREFTHTLDLDRRYDAPGGFPYACDDVPKPPAYRDAIVNAFVHVHQTLHAANQRLQRRGQRAVAVTPRHYLDFINHYVKLFHEKRQELEEQQLHLNVGLNKIKETEEQVKELQKSLSLKSKELEAKNAAANAKLKQMLGDQQRAEKEKATSEQLQAQLQTQMKEIAVKAASVKADLDKVEPAVLDAQTAVKSIKKQQLVEVRSMAQPPQPVKVALESICLLLGETVGTDWRAIRGIIVKDDFMPRMLNFDTESITPDIREKMISQYSSNPNWEYEKVNRASVACGPMVQWARAQLLYSDMLNRIEPLRNELSRLQHDADTTKKSGNEIKAEIITLEERISAYKEEYAQLIAQAEAIKADLASVQSKVDRSIHLLRSLSSERTRWESSCDGFRAQMETIVGDVLLSAAFLAYGGYFDQQLRQSLFGNWSMHLEQAAIQFRLDLARCEYLSNPDERLRWQRHALPSDELCTENAIMLKRFNRYPLIIDPSGQATEFLMNEYAERKISKISFLDDAFRKNLESALRFGNPLLVQDVESYDPILNPILNREVKRTGGRVLITLGDQDIDLSPSFQIFLSTRDPTVEFPPDVCSRVTFVNFTVTRGSLQSQCLNQVLKAERPDVDKKRADLMKLQGEFALRLRQLEKSLLHALNDAKGKILDDNSVISTLETLKQEAAEVSRKAAETDVVIAEVDQTSQMYTPLSQACSAIYFTLEQLNQIHFLYQYSLHFFLDIFTAILNDNEHLKDLTDFSQRLSVITTDLFQMTYNRVARGMLHSDRIVYALLLVRVYLKGVANEPNYDSEFDHVLRGSQLMSAGPAGASIGHVPALSSEQADSLAKLTALPSFANVAQGLSAKLSGWVHSANPENDVPLLWEQKSSLTPVGTALHRLLVIQALRPDRLLAASHLLVGAVFGAAFMTDADRVLDLGNIVDREIRSHMPVLLCSVPGYDASGRVEDLAAELNRVITPIAIGSAEGFSQADSVINSAYKSGRWVLLKNVHLAPQWLAQLEKKLHTLSPHPQFRLFLTMEIHPKLPVNLLRSGRIFVFEPPPGIKANLLRTFSIVSANRMSKAPAERARLYFVLAWFHAIVQERLRYTPLGWAKKYEFSEHDFRVACDTLDACVDAAALGRANLPPDKVPWEAMRTLLSQCIYGGRIDNSFDQTLLDCFIEKLFTASSFDTECVLIAGLDGADERLLMPDGVRREQFVQWTEAIRHLQAPMWLGLPNNAEKVLLTNRARLITRNLLKMKDAEDEDASGDIGGQSSVAKLLKLSGDDEELAYNPAGADASIDARPAWMKQLHDTAKHWLSLLPDKLTPMKRTIENIKDPLYRFFEREVNLGAKLLADVRQDLEGVVAVCCGAKKQTNADRLLTSALTKGIVPERWQRYTQPDGVTVIQWTQDFAERVGQLQRVLATVADGKASGLKHLHVWLGGLFSPAAYITATCQYVAQANAWSLEELRMEVAVADDANKLTMDDASFALTGMKLMGASCRKGRVLAVTDDIWTEMAVVRVTWVHAPDAATAAGEKTVALPVYLYPTRLDLLFTLDFETGDDDRAVFYKRGVAVICSTQLG